jgi:hypothetical protein
MFIDREKTRYCACGNYTSGVLRAVMGREALIHKMCMDSELSNRVRPFAELEVIRIVAARRKKEPPIAGDQAQQVMAGWRLLHE